MMTNTLTVQLNVSNSELVDKVNEYGKLILQIHISE